MKCARGNEWTLLDPARAARVEAMRGAEAERRAVETEARRQRHLRRPVAPAARAARLRGLCGRGLPYRQSRKPVPPGHRVPVLRIYPPAAFRTIREAAAATGLSESAISRAVRCRRLAGKSVWIACPPHLLRALRPELFPVPKSQPRQEVA